MKTYKANTRIIFYRSKENPDYYLLYSGRYSHKSEEMLYILNHIGKYEDSGYEQVDVELAYILETEHAKEFLNFIVQHIASDYIEHSFYSGGVIFAWCKLENYEPEQWHKTFDEFNEQKNNKINEKPRQRIQLALF